jgi:hypothetical protein
MTAGRPAVIVCRTEGTMTDSPAAQPVSRDERSSPGPIPPRGHGDRAGTAHRYQAAIVREHPRRWDPIAGREVFVPTGAMDSG